ncbi:MAG: cysteine--tRNA ligase, partial [Actinobacteria bacterium]|nr:cysteine--tRNA ligase [Actinomycetota bacterium]
RWRGSGDGNGALDEVRVALDHDLDTPAAIEAIDAAVDRGEAVSQAAKLLGVV